MLGTEKIVFEALGFLSGGIEQPAKRRRRVHLLLRLAARKAGQDRLEAVVELAGCDPELFQHGAHDARLLFDERAEQMFWLELRVVALLGVSLRGGDGLLRFFGQSVHVHVVFPLAGRGVARRRRTSACTSSIRCSSSRM